MTKMRNPGTHLRKDVQLAIEKAWPYDVVEMVGSDESYFWEVHLEVQAALQRLKGAWLVSEREAAGQPTWFDGSDREDDPPDDWEHDRSYHLFFVCPEGEAFTYKTEMESLLDPDEEEEDGDELPTGTVPGNGRTGWAVAVSTLAPFAVITLSYQESYEDGSFSEPSIQPPISDMGERVDLEAEFRESKGKQAFEVLLKLRGRISAILDRNGISVLPEEEWRKPVPWLRAGEEVLVSTMGEPVRVLDALFFEGL